MTTETAPETDIATYHDGSGKASETLAWNLGRLDKRQAIIDVTRAFIEKHKGTLAGLAWSPDIYDAELEVECWYRRGQKTTAKEVAALWPGVNWRRVEPEHGINKDTERDWLGTIDGVQIRIRRAEVYRPVKVEPWPQPERVCFYEQDFYVLSNFSAFKLVWKGLRFDTSEAAYHFEKFTAPEYHWIQDLILAAPSAHEALRVAREHNANRRPDWDDVKLDIMREILSAKAEQHEYVRRKLLATGDRELVENSWRDDFWGWGPNRDGQNWLGKLWMEVRAELRIDAMTPAEVDTHLVSKGFDLAKVDASCARLRAKLESRGIHGVTCQKAPHDPQRAGYLHEADDDSPYSVDGMRYCGRCHHAL